jgi:hypothetical protein
MTYQVPVKDLGMKESPTMARMGLIFCLLYFFSICGVIALSLGYDFFHSKNPNGAEGIVFLMFGGATLFFGVKLINAFTDPLPAWLDYWMTPAHRAPVTERQKTTMFLIYAFLYVAMMTELIFIFMGPRLGLSLERIALPLLFGFLAVLVLTSLLQMFAAFYTFWKDRQTSQPYKDPQ